MLHFIDLLQLATICRKNYARRDINFGAIAIGIQEEGKIEGPI